jgi:hypothetical protein
VYYIGSKPNNGDDPYSRSPGYPLGVSTQWVARIPAPVARVRGLGMSDERDGTPDTKPIRLRFAQAWRGKPPRRSNYDNPNTNPTKPLASGPLPRDPQAGIPANGVRRG